MTTALPATALEMRTLIRSSDRTLELSLVDVPVPTPNTDEVLVQVQAAPINPRPTCVRLPEAARPSGRR